MGLIYDNRGMLLLRKSPLTMGGRARNSAKFILRMRSKPGENLTFSCTEILPPPPYFPCTEIFYPLISLPPAINNDRSLKVS